MSLFKGRTLGGGRPPPQRTSSEIPPERHHKGLTYRPVQVCKNKRQANAYLKQLRKDEKGNLIRVADRRYYRVYRHKYQGYIVYVASKGKLRYGGTRRRSKTGTGRYTKYR